MRRDKEGASPSVKRYGRRAAARARHGQVAGGANPAGRVRRRLVLMLKVTFGLALFTATGVGIFVAVAYSRLEIPVADREALAQTAVITYADGTELARLGMLDRQNVTLLQVPGPMRNAVLAAEDHTFYSNVGVEPTSILRAVIANVRGGAPQGGSTITQQYVKNVYNRRERTMSRKFDEILLAVKIGRHESKDAILERYLNTIYFGRGAYGIQAASRAYFHRDVEKLTVAQSAYLAGIVNAPNSADPTVSAQERARAQRRWNVVLDAMVREGMLSAEVRSKQTFPHVFAPKRANTFAGQNGYLVSMVEAEVRARLKLSDQELRSGGYRIRTTFDSNLVQVGQAVVEESLPKNAKQKGVQVGLTAIDPATGAIRAIYGGRDYLKRPQNSATQDGSEAGATFSTFTLLAALRGGVDLFHPLPGNFTLDVAGYPIQNLGGVHHPKVDLLQATRESVNTAYAVLNERIGPARTRQAAYDAGISRQVRIDSTVTNTLGLASPRTVDLAGAYATLAADGVRRKPYVIESVIRNDTGKVLLQGPAGRGTKAFTAEETRTATAALQEVVSNGTAKAALDLERPAAGQTGTSASARSAWFVGYTPQLSTAVTMYRLSRDGSQVLPMTGIARRSDISGGGIPTRIWTRFTKTALADQPVATFPPPGRYVSTLYGLRPAFPVEKGPAPRPLGAFGGSKVPSGE